jgi:hypothetical protein
LVLSINKIFTIKNHKLDDAFLHVAFGSQSQLRTTSELTCFDTNGRTEEVTRGGVGVGRVNGSLIKFFHKKPAYVPHSKPQRKPPEIK